MVSPQGRREQCAYACGRGISKRRACGLIGMARSTLSYELRQRREGCSRDCDHDAAFLAVSALRLSSDSDLLRREGLAMSASRAERLWRKAGLQLPRKRPRRRIAAVAATARCRHAPPIMSGPTISSSMPVPTGSRLNA